ncbi:HNH endonuclease signature motif containing protein [Streptomyces vilmorinianum]|uniref:HNH endonuclease signature motif containing protein n=1 Tax=Streptomyces vilmorinianum TaxID=3051092 RepID=UPI0010FBAA29|nr:HNH endonuclease signature motif containing protein [Streptomyces vilmorinianum]
MSTFERPERLKTPKYLVAATYRMLGTRCLRCDLDRPLEVAHIVDWPSCFASAGEEIDGLAPPEAWHYAEAISRFHDLGNVLPLCCNCHTLYDGKQYTDVTESEIRGYRDAAVRKPEALSRLIDFVGTELRGRPGRCIHKVGSRREHTHTADPVACSWPLTWISQGYELGLVAEDPNLIVMSAECGFHYHVPLTTTEIRMCSGELSECGRGGRVWKRRRTGRRSLA